MVLFLLTFWEDVDEEWRTHGLDGVENDNVC